MGPSSAFLGSTVSDSGCHLIMAARRTSSGVCAGNDSTRYFRQSRRVVVVVVVLVYRSYYLRDNSVVLFTPLFGTGLLLQVGDCSVATDATPALCFRRISQQHHLPNH